jgi:hypothetical protein
MVHRLKSSMLGKYKNPVYFHAAKCFRWIRTARLRGIVPAPAANTELLAGCTVIMAMPHRLPTVLFATLEFLNQCAWNELKRTIVCVDCPDSLEMRMIEEDSQKRFPSLKIEFVFYSNDQFKLANRLSLPYIFSWLSWSIAISKVQTKTLFIQDYDALNLKPCLEARYKAFLQDGSKFQGISWYEANGISKRDRLATTFQAFIETEWVRSFDPLLGFNRVGKIEDRTVDFDTFLFAQYHFSSTEDRVVVSVLSTELMHPSQMVHQYTMFRRFPRRAQPCFSIIHIPFFEYWGGNTQAFQNAAQRLRRGTRRASRLLLDAAQINWALEQMITVFRSKGLFLPDDLFEYGDCLYDLVEEAKASRWKVLTLD